MATLALHPRRRRGAFIDLPNELWYIIWHDLDLDERVVLTHVCRRWRLLAGRTPSLWQDIDIELFLHLESIQPVHTVLPLKPRLIIRSTRNRRALRNLIIALVRSGSRPVSLSIAIFGISRSAYHMHPVAALSMVVKKHAARLSRVDIRYYDDADVSEWCPKRLLRSGDFLSRPNLAPTLRSLALNDIIWPQGVRSHLPSLSELTVCVTDMGDVLAILRSCPALRLLDIKFTSRADHEEDWEDETYESVAQVASDSSLSVVRIRDVPESTVDDMVQCFGDVPLEGLAIHHRAASAIGYVIFGHLDIESLAISAIFGRITIRCEEAPGGCWSELQLGDVTPDVAFHEVLPWVHFPSLKTFAFCQDSLMQILMSGMALPPMPQVHTLRITLYPWPERSFRRNVHMNAQSLSFPALRHMTLVFGTWSNDEECDTISKYARWLGNAADLLGIGEPLETLTLVRIKLRNPHASRRLRAFAHRVIERDA
ncbi:hypothetical protein EXIGLDRAFT_836448 [Exidia glandulosa HHB12029]|uniref:F-box domain-containing protein n=1 Tax=Exidia glandulosa HHB12029 TaxID=1314781 RepID=A0A165HTJ8_EXIGL|nr:hypothetical protein EXIGLDRAFT_836448 [Exidia glandulosa HHB12029]